MDSTLDAQGFPRYGPELKKINLFCHNLPTASMVHLILVHGTFARRSSWIKSDGRLSGAISSQISEKIKTTPFHWSGSNTFFDRAYAVTKLRRQLAAIRSSHPKGKIFVVAHSHGGNIALQAASDGLINGLICLATPVLVSARRKISLNGAPVLAAALLLILVFGSGDLLLPWLGSSYILFKAVIIAPCLWWLSFKIYSRLSALYSAASSQAQKSTDFIIKSTKRPLLDYKSVIFIRHPGDEASSAIGVATLSEWVIGRCTIFLNKLTHPTEIFLAPGGKLKLRLVLIVILPLFIGASISLAPPQYSQYSQYWYIGQHIMIFPIYAMVIFAMITALTGLLLLIAPALLACVIGREMFLAAFRVRVTAEPTPEGIWCVSTLNSNIASEHQGDINQSPFPYAHGGVYENPAVHAFIAQWISERINTDNRATT